MSQLSLKKRKLLLRYVSYNPNQASLYYAKVLFKRFDNKTIKKHHFNCKVVFFDSKNGRYCDLKWKDNFTSFIIRVIRTKKNTCFVYKRNFLYDIFMWFYILFLNIQKK